jgi:multidrug efflux system membrane fusion protein
MFPCPGSGMEGLSAGAILMSFFTLQFRMPCILFAMAALVGCGDQPPPPSETVRAIKTITVTERATGMQRRFSGVVEAADTSSLSFQVPGNVLEVNVNVGERVTQGQVLAALDDRTFGLNVDAARASRGRAQTELTDARRDWERFRKAVELNPGAVSGRSVSQAEAVYLGAVQGLSYANSRLNLAKRDLENTVLRAPFDGIVARRFVNPFQEVARVEPLFVLNMEGAMEAAISIPESEIDLVHLGLPAEIRFPAIPTEVRNGIVTEISNVAGTTNAFPVKITIENGDGNERIRPGITAEVNLLFADEGGEAAYLVPLGALAPAGSEGTGYVFVYDPASSKVDRTAVEIGGIRDNDVIVNAGLNVGDIIAVAGVSFLRDGQQVKLMGGR